MFPVKIPYILVLMTAKKVINFTFFFSIINFIFPQKYRNAAFFHLSN